MSQITVLIGATGIFSQYLPFWNIWKVLHWWRLLIEEMAGHLALNNKKVLSKNSHLKLALPKPLIAAVIIFITSFPDGFQVTSTYMLLSVTMLPTIYSHLSLCILPVCAILANCPSRTTTVLMVTWRRRSWRLKASVWPTASSDS